MRLASLKHGRDGRLVVVSRDLARAVAADGIAPTLQAALDDWAGVEPALRRLAEALECGSAEGCFAFDEQACASPLPRAYQWLDGSAYVTHVELLRKARGAVLPERFWTDPLMYQGASDRFAGPRDPIEAGEDWGLDFEAEIAVVTDDVAMGTPAGETLQRVRLLMLVNDVSARALIPDEVGKGFGFIHGKPASAFSPVAVTPDALGDAWRDGKLHGPLLSSVNGHRFGRPDAGVDMTFGFAELIAHAAHTRHLGAGNIIGSGTVANEAAREVGRGIGHSCLAERRMIETIRHGEALTPWLRPGDRVRIEMHDPDGRSIFGAIDQEVVRYSRAAGLRLGGKRARPAAAGPAEVRR